MDKHLPIARFDVVDGRVSITLNDAQANRIIAMGGCDVYALQPAFSDLHIHTRILWDHGEELVPCTTCGWPKQIEDKT